MSLLTSSATSRDNKRFINKIEKELPRRSFFKPAYSESPHPFKQLNDTTEQAAQLIKQTIDQFLESLREIISQAHSSKIDYYFILSKMNNSDFFSEVAGMLNQEIISKNIKLSKQNHKLRQQLRKVQNQLRENSKVKKQNQKNDISRFSGIKSIAENLHSKARIMNEQQFSELCNKVILQNKVVIKRVSEGEAYKKWDQLKVEKVEQQQLLKRIDTFIQQKQGQGIDAAQTQFVSLVQALRKINQEARTICRRPCCQQRSDVQPTSRSNKGDYFRRSLDGRYPSQIYKDDKSEQYFNRYYRRSEFDIHKVISIQQTKLEQMQKLEDNHRVSMKMRRKVKSMLSR